MSRILRSAVHKLKFCKCLIGMLPSGSFPGGSQSVPLIKSASNASLFMTREEGGKKTLMHQDSFSRQMLAANHQTIRCWEHRFRLKIAKSCSKTQYLKGILILPPSTEVILFASQTDTQTNNSSESDDVLKNYVLYFSFIASYSYYAIYSLSVPCNIFRIPFYHIKTLPQKDLSNPSTGVSTLSGHLAVKNPSWFRLLSYKL